MCLEADFYCDIHCLVFHEQECERIRVHVELPHNPKISLELNKRSRPLRCILIEIKENKIGITKALEDNSKTYKHRNKANR